MSKQTPQNDKELKRCVNLDWVEVYAKEGSKRYPLNADYFRSHGYFVSERDYGTRVYAEMFTIEDKEGHPFIEVRRKPMAGTSDFSGLDQYSCHLRLVNRACYYEDAISRLRDFMVEHDYEFQRIFRLDICYDFVKFDFGDAPCDVAQRIVSKKYRKINQGHMSTHSEDRWDRYEWETLSWGSKTSMVSTKMYNKTKELSSPKSDKPYIRQIWFESGLIDDPINMTKKDEHGRVKDVEVWRIEFSLKSSARNWLVIEDQSGKKVKKKSIPHSLACYDSKDKLWQRFQDLAYHYFRFKIQTYIDEKPSLTRVSLQAYEFNREHPLFPLHSESQRKLQRKDRCPDKKLFKWDDNHVFHALAPLAPESKPEREEISLKRRLSIYRQTHSDPDVRRSCDILIQSIDDKELRRLTATGTRVEIEAIRLKIAAATGWSYSKVCEEAEKVRELLIEKEIW